MRARPIATSPCAICRPIGRRERQKTRARKSIISSPPIFPPRKINTVYCRMIGNEIETERERENFLEIILLRFIEPIKRRWEGRKRKRVRERGLGRKQNELSLRKLIVRGGNSLEIMIFFSPPVYRRRISFCPNWGKIGR